MQWNDKVVAAGFSVFSNTILVIAKIIIGGITGSITIISEGLHSGIDLLASLIAFFSLREVRKPADKEHPFGHGKIENVSGFIQALLILFAAVFIIHEAIGKLIHGSEVEKIGLGVFVMALATVTNIIVSVYLFYVAKKTGSLALEADAEHLRTDVYTSIGVMFSLALIHFTGQTIIDPIVAILVAIYIGIIAVKLTIKSSHDLMDARLTESEEAQIKKVLDNVPEILNYHNLRTRRSGNDRFIDFHAIVSGMMDINVSHNLTSSIERKIEAVIKGSNVTIHIEPCLGDCEECNHPCPEEKRPDIAKQRTSIPGTDKLTQEVNDALSNVEGVSGIQDLHIHQFDGKWEVQVDVLVPADIMVQEGHNTAENVENAIRTLRKDLGKVTVHIEPEETKDKNSVLSFKEELIQEISNILSKMQGVIGIDDINIYLVDGKWEILLDLVVPPNILVEESHEIAEKVEKALRKTKQNLRNISIHIEPEGHIDIERGV